MNGGWAGIVIGVIFLAILSIVFNILLMLHDRDIRINCDKLGKTIFSGVVYTCSKERP